VDWGVFSVVCSCDAVTFRSEKAASRATSSLSAESSLERRTHQESTGLNFLLP
jgi:hypothetical protein